MSIVEWIGDTNTKLQVHMRCLAKCPIWIKTKILDRSLTLANHCKARISTRQSLCTTLGQIGNWPLTSKLTIARGWAKAFSHKNAASDATTAPSDMPSQTNYSARCPLPTNQRPRLPAHIDAIEMYESPYVNSIVNIETT